MRMNRDKFRPTKQNKEVLLKKLIDNKILTFLSEEEYKHVLSESLVRVDSFIGIMTKIAHVLTKISLETKSSENSYAHEFTSPRTLSLSHPAEIIKFKLPKLKLKLFDGKSLNWQPFPDKFSHP